MLSARKGANNDDEANESQIKSLAWNRFWHKSINKTHSDIPICAQFKSNRLNRLEREIVMVLIMEQLGLINDYISDTEDILKYLHLSPKEMLKGMRYMSEESRLYRNGLIEYEDIDDPLASRTILVDPSLIDAVLYKRLPGNHIWPVKDQAGLFDYMRRLTSALQKKSESLQDNYRGLNSRGNAFTHSRRVNSILRSLKATLDTQRDWPLYELLTKFRSSYADWVMILALVGKELGHISVDDDLFEGSGLARAASPDKEYNPRVLRSLLSDSPLRRKGWIQPCGGNHALISDDTTDLEDTEFELSEKAIKFLNIKPKIAVKKNGNVNLREPKIKLSDLVYSEEVNNSIRIALAQTHHANTLFHDWGLGEKLSYGRGVTCLFAGPPGTGKTASAEAIAGELGKSLLVANYAKIQNCFVGQTEKNIVATFREAREKDAVLLWDEADAMFYDRDSADRNWEVRDVNVLLQEIERFDGICILTTNRKVKLDKALERRISLKIEFDPPGRNAREIIFKKLIPKKMPLDKDVSFRKLAQYDLSGGEIKNVILNAARIALHRNGSKSKVAMADFQQAMEDYKAGSWPGNSRKKIGFDSLKLKHEHKLFE